MGWFSRKPQPKDEHPMQEVWDSLPSDPPQGGSVITSSGGQSNRALLRLMKAVEEQVVNPPQGGDATIPVERDEYGFPVYYRSPVVPAPRVDKRLIGDDQR